MRNSCNYRNVALAQVPRLDCVSLIARRGWIAGASNSLFGDVWMSAAAANDDNATDPGRRHFLRGATTSVGLAGVAATAVPFLASWRPSAQAKALGAPVEVDISKLEVGALMKVEWRGQAIYIVNRTEEMVKKLAGLDAELKD